MVFSILQSTYYPFFFADDLAKYQRRVRNSRNKLIRDEGEKYLEALRHALEKADGLEEIFKKHIEDKSGKFAAAEKFYKENGHLQIPAKYVSPDGIKLGNWISYLKNVRICLLSEQNTILLLKI